MEPAAPLKARDRWRAWRNRRLADPRFQRFSWAFPLFRPIAKRRSRELFDLVAGFAYSQVLYTCVRLKIFEKLSNGPLTLEEIVDWPRPESERLLKAAIALKLIERYSDGRYGLGIHGAALVGNPWIGKFIEHHDRFYADLADPIPLLRGDAVETELRKYWAYASTSSPDATAAYTALMAASQHAVAEEILHAYDFSKHRSLLDVGGGNGTFLKAVARRYPDLELTLFDLPGVIAHVEAGPAIRAVGGNFLGDPLPQGADVVTLIRVVHDHERATVGALFTAIRAVLPPGGALIVAEPLSGIRGTEPVTDAYFNLYFAAMGSGETRDHAAIAALGRAAGFPSCRVIETRNPMLTGVVVMSD